MASDHLGRTVAASPGVTAAGLNATWIAYDVVFALADELLGLGVSAILDLNLGRAFQWQRLDALRQHHPAARVVPVVLRCPCETCLERLRRRHMADPATSDPPERFTTDPRILEVFAFLDRLDRPDAAGLDANGTEDAVYAGLIRLPRQRLQFEGRQAQ